MRKFMQMVQRCSLALPLLFAGARQAVAQPAGSGWMQTQAAALERAARQLGVPVQTSRMLYFAQNGAVFFTAPAANLATIPASELPRGVNLGVAYLEAPGQRFPAGYYVLKMITDPQRAGTAASRLQLIGRDGRVAADLPSVADIRLAAPPSRTEGQIAEVRFATGCPGDATNPPPLPCLGPYLWTCAFVNGYWQCHVRCLPGWQFQ